MPTSSPISALLQAQRIAIVGLSEGRVSETIARFLQSHGREIVPVNPTKSKVIGLTSYPSLHDVPGKIDLVNVFRGAHHCPAIVRDTIAVHAGGVWLQSGIISPEAEQLARDASLPFVQNRCIMVEMR